MFHLDGRCATSAEAVYVSYVHQPCLNSPTQGGGGTPAAPFCDLATALASAGNRQLFILRGNPIAGGATVQSALPISIIGQQDGLIFATRQQPGLVVIDSDVYIRGLQIFGDPTSTIGIVVQGAGSIRLDGVTIALMPRGGLRVSSPAGYDIINSIFDTNGGTPDDSGLFVGGAYLGKPDSARPHRFAFNTVTGNKGGTGVNCASGSQSLDASLLAANMNAAGVVDFATCTLAPTSKAFGGDSPGLKTARRLNGISECRNFVSAPPPGAPDHDIDGLSRPHEGFYDCGASEYWSP